MSNVIGPIPFNAWYTMRMLQENIRNMRNSSTNDINEILIKQETRVLGHFYDEVFGRNKDGETT